MNKMMDIFYKDLINLLILLILQRFQFRLLRSPFQGQPNPLWLLRILLLTYLIRRTSGRRLSWHT